MSDLVDDVARAIDAASIEAGEPINSPDLTPSAKAAIAATLKALEASFIEDGYSVRGARIVKLHRFARDNGVNLDPD